jgi:hypothetical protein
MLAVEGVLVYLLLSRRSGAKEMGEKSKLEAHPVGELGIANERALPEPSLSVTDHTTRTLEPAHRDRTRE